MCGIVKEAEDVALCAVAPAEIVGVVYGCLGGVDFVEDALGGDGTEIVEVVEKRAGGRGWQVAVWEASCVVGYCTSGKREDLEYVRGARIDG